MKTRLFPALDPCQWSKRAFKIYSNLPRALKTRHVTDLHSQPTGLQFIRPSILPLVYRRLSTFSLSIGSHMLLFVVVIVVVDVNGFGLLVDFSSHGTILEILLIVSSLRYCFF